MLNRSELTTFHKELKGKKYDRLPIVFNALGDPVRCKIARLLIKKGKRNLSVNNIAEIMGISQSSASQHLKILEITGVVYKEAHGRLHYYGINQMDPIVTALIRAVM